MRVSAIVATLSTNAHLTNPHIDMRWRVGLIHIMMNFNRSNAAKSSRIKSQPLNYSPFLKLSVVDLTTATFDHQRTEWQSPPSTLSSGAGAFAVETYRPMATGISMWEISTPNQFGWLDWDWALLSNGIITLLNPSDIRSNLVLLDQRNHLLSMHDTTAMLAATVHQLRWREQVEMLLN